METASPSAPSPAQPPAQPSARPPNYSVPCTYKQFAVAFKAAVADGTLTGDEGLEMRKRIEIAFRRLACRQMAVQYGSEARARGGEGFVPPASVVIFCCETGAYGDNVALQWAHNSMAQKAADQTYATEQGWLNDFQGMGVSDLVVGSSRISRLAVLLSLSHSRPTSAAWNRGDEGNSAVRHEELLGAVQAQRAAALSGGTEPPLKYSTAMVRALDGLKKVLPCISPGCQYAAADVLDADLEEPADGTEELPDSLPNVAFMEGDSPEQEEADGMLARALASISPGALAEQHDSPVSDDGESPTAMTWALTPPPPARALNRERAYRPLPEEAHELTLSQRAEVHAASRPSEMLGSIDGPRALRSHASVSAAVQVVPQLPTVPDFTDEEARAEMRAEMTAYYPSKETAKALGLAAPLSLPHKGQEQTLVDHFVNMSMFRAAAINAPYADNPFDPRFADTVEEYSHMAETRFPQCVDCANSFIARWYREEAALEHFNALGLLQSADADGWTPGEREYSQELIDALRAQQSEDYAAARVEHGCPCLKDNSGRTFTRWGGCCHCQGQPLEELCPRCRPYGSEGFKPGGRRVCSLRALKRVALAGGAGPS